MAANSGIIDGGDILVYLNTGTDSVPIWAPAFHCTECSIEHSMTLRTRKTKDTGAASEKRPDELSTTINVSALATYDATGKFNYFSLRAAQLAKSKLMLKYSGRPEADETAGLCDIAEAVGDFYEKGYFYITKVSRNDKKGEDSTMSATFENTGLPTIETVAAS
jgi:hypothetical protein